MNVLSHILVGVGSFILGGTAAIAIFVRPEDETWVQSAYQEGTDEVDSARNDLDPDNVRGTDMPRAYLNLHDRIYNYSPVSKTSSQTASGGLTEASEIVSEEGYSEDDVVYTIEPLEEGGLEIEDEDDSEELEESDGRLDVMDDPEYAMQYDSDHYTGRSVYYTGRIVHDENVNVLFEDELPSDDELPDEDEDPGEEGWTDSIIIKQDGTKVRTTKGGNVEVVDPYVITEEEFDLGELGFTKTTLNYYLEDDVLVTDRGEIIANSNQLVGKGHLEDFDELSNADNVMFVRNTALGIDFEVDGFDESYFESVLGAR